MGLTLNVVGVVAGGYLLQGGAIDLAGRIERYLVEELDLLRRLVADPRFRTKAMSSSLPGRSASGRKADIGADNLAMQQIVDADHPGIVDGRMLT